MNQGLTIEVAKDFAEALSTLIGEMASKPIIEATDDEKMLLHALVEVRHRLYVKLAKHQIKYKITLTAVQALALRILYTDYVNNHTSYVGIHLLKISNQVNQKFS